MKKMMIAIVVGALCIMVAHNSEAAPAKTASKQQIAHGEYLVKAIGQCGECHTPMDEKGVFVQGKWLQGTKLTLCRRFPCPIGPTLRPTLPGWKAGTTRRRSSSS